MESNLFSSLATDLLTIGSVNQLTTTQFSPPNLLGQINIQGEFYNPTGSSYISLDLAGTSSIEPNSTDQDAFFLQNLISQYSSDPEPLDFYAASSDALNPGFSFNFDFGFGLVDAAAAVSRALGNTTAFADVPTPVINAYGSDLVKAPEVWNQGYTGKGIVIAVIDTGIDLTHPDLKDHIWQNLKEIPGDGIDNDKNGFIDDTNGYDFAGRDRNPSNNTAQEIHGSHVAGIIAASRDGVDAVDRNNNPYEVTGIAYDAKIMAVRVLDSLGRGSATNVAAGIRYAVDNGANIINLSLGSAMTSQLELDALRYADERGVVVVSAAGNNGFTATSPDFPARLASTNDYGIAVGAIDSNKTVATFSNPAGTSSNGYPFVVAPGVKILSTVPGGNYTTLSGTSMATPFVSGVIALMLQANPKLTPAQVEKILSETANPNGIVA